MVICGFVLPSCRSFDEEIFLGPEKISEICIMWMILLCAWVTLIDTWLGILIDKLVFMEVML